MWTFFVQLFVTILRFVKLNICKPFKMGRDPLLQKKEENIEPFFSRTGREISHQSKFCTQFQKIDCKTFPIRSISQISTWSIPTKSSLSKFKKYGSRVALLRSQFHRRNHLCSLQGQRYPPTQKLWLFCHSFFVIAPCLFYSARLDPVILIEHEED